MLKVSVGKAFPINDIKLTRQLIIAKVYTEILT